MVKSAAARQPGTEAVAVVHAGEASERMKVVAVPFVAPVPPTEAVGFAPAGPPVMKFQPMEVVATTPPELLVARRELVNPVKPRVVVVACVVVLFKMKR